MKINVEKWNQDRINAETELKALKQSIRFGGLAPGEVYNPKTHSWEKQMINRIRGQGSWRDYQNLASLKLLATNLYRVRAYARGRHHTPGLDPQKELEEIQVYLETYLVDRPEETLISQT